MRTLHLIFISCVSLLLVTLTAQGQGTIAITKYPAYIPAPSVDQDSTSAPPFALYVTFTGGSASSQYFLKVGTPTFTNVTYLMFTYRNSGALAGTWGRAGGYTDSNFTFQTDVAGRWEGWVPVKAQKSGINQISVRARLAIGSNINSAVYGLSGMIVAGSGAGYLVGNLLDGTGGDRQNKVVVAYSGTTPKGIWLSEVNSSSHALSTVPLNELHSNYSTALGSVNAQGGYAMLVPNGSPSIDRLEIYSYQNNSGSSPPLATYVITFVYQNVPVPDAIPVAGQPASVGVASSISLNPIVQNGDGSASLTNEAAGLLNGTTIFAPNSGAQTAKISILGSPAGSLDQVRLTVPAGFSGGSVALGLAFAGKSYTVVGSQITIQNANLSTFAGEITVSNLTSSNPVGPLLSGDDKWTVETAAPGGTLVEIVSSPHSQTIIPISNIRTGGEDGFGNNLTGDSTRMHNQTVATTGVVTFENGILQDLNASFVLQSGGKGVEVFRYGAAGAVIHRGDSILVKGVVSAFGGATEIIPASSGFPDIVNAGTGVLPSPAVLSNASDLSEANECLLVHLNQVVFDSAGQQFIATTSNRGANNFHTSLADTGAVWLSGLNTIIGDPIPPSADFTGVALDRLWYRGPGMPRYKIAPRDSADIVGPGVNVSLASGWNLISNPVTNPVPGDSVRHLYPTSVNSYVFEFSGGYVQRYRLENGKGYWGKFPGAISNAITGTPRARDSISVVEGWNLVGTISNPVDTNTIVSVPPGLRASVWYGYGGGYTAVAQLVPGKGYWVKSNGTGKFVLANPLGKVNASVSGPALADVLNTLTITDSRGGSQTLYFGGDAEGQPPVSMYVMPPLPPVGAFDARFSSAEGGLMVQRHAVKVSGPVEFSVEIQSDAYPVTVSWNVSKGTASYELADGRGGKDFRPREMTGEGSVKITESELNKITVRIVGDGQLPAEFALSQNFPNPFNPTTSVKYALPVESRVTMEIYNVLGQRVRTLVSENIPGGYHVADWDGMNDDGRQLSSSVYFLRLSATGTNGMPFSEVRKLMMVK